MVSIADDLCGADIGEVKGVEEKDKILAFIVRGFDLREGLVRKNSNSLKVRSWLSGDKSKDGTDESQAKKIFHNYLNNKARPSNNKVYDKFQ